MSASLESIELIYPDGDTKSVTIEGDFPPDIASSLQGKHILRISVIKDQSDTLCVSLDLQNSEGKDVQGVVIPAHPLFSFGWQREVKSNGGEIQEEGIDPILGMRQLNERIQHIVEFGPMIGLVHGLIHSLVGQTIGITPAAAFEKIDPKTVIPVDPK